jgi:DNA-binding LacI/PurR family transcriptional regulator
MLRRVTAGRPTIADVAAKAGVSLGTASDALNFKGRMTDETRERVTAAAAQMGYLPSSAARGLAAGRTMALGVRVGGTPGIPDVGFFFVSLLNAAAGEAAANGYGLMVTTPELEEHRIVDGLLIVDPLTADEVIGPLESGLPLVTVGHSPVRPAEIPSVDIDYAGSLDPMFDHLGEVAGPGRALLISPPKRPSYIKDIEAAFKTWCKENGRRHRVAICRNDADAVTALIASDHEKHGDYPRILIGVLDRHAVWAQRAILNAGRAVPGDVVVAAATDGEPLRLVEPAITALDLDGAAHGLAGVKLLLAQLDGSNGTRADALVHAGFTVRASSGG